MKSTSRIGVLVAAAAITFGVSTAVPAFADTPGPTIFADLNNDGVPDQVSFAQVGDPSSTTCSVTVSFGLLGGGFGTPHVHDYTSAERQAPFCPDLAVAMKLGDDKRPDLVTGFSFGGQDSSSCTTSGRPPCSSASTSRTGCAPRISTERPQYALADFSAELDRSAFAVAGDGEDMLLSTDCPNDPVPQKAEVLFGNGQATAVLDTSTDFPPPGRCSRSTWTRTASPTRA